MTPPIPILLYHSIGTTESAAYRQWTVSPATFARHMAHLVDDGYHPMTVAALIAARRTGSLPDRPVAVTFDDGLRDFLTGALPTLERLGIPATLFVATGYVGATARWLADSGEGGRPMLTWRELREIAALGIECGGHTRTHPQLDIVGTERARTEIAESRADLEDHLGIDVVSFAYPHGYASATTRRLAREAGYRAACRVRHALSSADEDVFALSRVVVTESSDLAALLAGTGLPIAPPPDRMIGYGWRMARRAMRLAHVGGDAR